MGKKARRGRVRVRWLERKKGECRFSTDLSKILNTRLASGVGPGTFIIQETIGTGKTRASRRYKTRERKGL